MPQLEYATPILNFLSKSQIQTLERIQRSHTKFMLGYESPLTYPDRLNRLNMLSLSYRRDISDLCQLGYKKILDHYLQTVYILEMTRDVLDNLNHQIFQYHNTTMPRCKNEQFRKFYFNRVYYIAGTSFPRVLKMRAHYLVSRKA